MSENESSVKIPIRSADARSNGPSVRDAEEALSGGQPSRAIVSRPSHLNNHVAGGPCFTGRVTAVRMQCVASVTGSVRGDISRAGRGSDATIVRLPVSDRPAPDVSPDVNAENAWRRHARTGAGEAPMRTRPGSWTGRMAAREDGCPVPLMLGGALGTPGTHDATDHTILARCRSTAPRQPVHCTGGDS